MIFKPIGIVPILLVISIFIFAESLIAQQNYAVSNIPENLLKNANAVVQEETALITIESNGKYTQNVKRAVTILNQNGKSFSSRSFPYDRFSKISNLSAKIYDADGFPLKGKGLVSEYDFGYASNGTLYSDTRYKVLSSEYEEYPYTIVYEYIYTINEGIGYPSWYPVNNYNLSVRYSRMKIRKSPGNDFRFFEKNFNDNTVKITESDNTIYTWELKDQPAFIDEPYSNSIRDLSPSVLLSPSEIDFDGYKGNLDTWSGFGKWISLVNENTEKIPESSINSMVNLTAGLSSNREKIKAVYEYMQNKTRYINITVGIGGFKPINAADVDRLGYGDCKALSNYTRALLAAAGIKSYYTLIYAGDEKIQIESDFPSNQFNHIILCVPDENDTIWLECTSQTIPFNFLGKFTSDRHALLITEDGGRLVKTPEFHRGENIRSRNVAVILDQDGNGTASVHTIYSGDFYDDYREILAKDKEGQKKTITEKLHIPKFEFIDFSITEDKKADPYSEENIKVSLTGYFTTVANKKIMQLNLMSKIERNPFNSRDRSNDIVFTWPYKSVDTVTYQLPEGYSPEKLPQPVNLSYDFATYRNEVTMKDGKLIYIRTLELIPGLYKKDRYKEFSTFFDKVASSDAMKIAIISNQ